MNHPDRIDREEWNEKVKPVLVDKMCGLINEAVDYWPDPSDDEHLGDPGFHRMAQLCWRTLHNLWRNIEAHQ